MIDNIKTFLKKFKDSPKSQIIINGKSYSGNNVSIVNGKVTIDGKVQDVADAKKIHIEIKGDIGSLNLDCGEIEVSGDVGDLVAHQGDVTIGGDVKGVATLHMGDLECTDIYSDVHLNMGNVKASTIHGSATTKMGNISR